MAVDLSHLLVTGGQGMIGRALPFGMKLSRGDLDVTDQAKVKQIVREMKPSAIVHLAGIDMHQAEEDPREATRVNVFGTYFVAQAAREAKIPLVFLSSGAVFNGEAGSVHDEDSVPNPVNLYGQTKWQAEILIQETLDDYCIVRTGWVFGGHQAHHRKFVDRTIEEALADQPIEATCDHWGSPTFVKDLASELGGLISSNARGLIHVANEGRATGVDIATEIVRLLGSRSRILPRKQVDSQKIRPPRSASEVLKSRRCLLRPWREALQEYLFSKQAQKR